MYAPTPLPPSTCARCARSTRHGAIQNARRRAKTWSVPIAWASAAKARVKSVTSRRTGARPEIFQWFDKGMSVNQICHKLTDEGFQWLPDVIRHHRPVGMPTPHIHRQCIRNLLTDCRYQGRQRHREKSRRVRATSYPRVNPWCPQRCLSVSSRGYAATRGERPAIARLIRLPVFCDADCAASHCAPIAQARNSKAARCCNGTPGKPSVILLRVGVLTTCL